MRDRAKRQGRITMLAFTLQGVFFFTGYCFFDVNTVIPVFIEAFTGRVELAGIPSAIRQFSTLSVQILLGSYIVKVKNVPRYLSLCLLIGYSMPLLVAAALGFGLESTALLPVIFSGVAVMWICDGLVVIGYYDLLGRTVSAQNRGRVLGYQQLLGGIGAMGAAVLIKKILDRTDMELTERYIRIFTVGGCVLILGAISMLFAKDTEKREAVRRYSLLEELGKIPGCLKGNRSLRKVMLCQVCFTGAMMLSPYILLLCKEQFRMPEQMVSTMLNFQVLGTLAGGGISAFFAPKFGNRFIVTVYCGLGLFCGLSGLSGIYGVGNQTVNAFLMVVTSGIANASWAGFYNVMIDLADVHNTHVYMLINSIVTLPLSAVGMLAGQIVRHAGYTALLAVSLVLAAGAMIASIDLLKEKDADGKNKGCRSGT